MRFDLFLLVLIFILSALDKVTRFNYNVQKVAKLGFPLYIAYLAILLAIAIQSLGPLYILTDNKQNKVYAYHALIIYTIMATLMFHFPPTSARNYYPFVSNVALVGGLLRAKTCL